MRGSVLVCLWLILLVMPGAMAAQVMEDEAGDVQTRAGGMDTGAGGSDTVDLLALDVTEDMDVLRFTVTMASTAPSNEDGESIRIELRHRDQPYAITFVRDAGQADYRARLSAQPQGHDFYSTIEWLAVEQDDRAGTLTTRLERYKLPDRNGAAPFIGRTIEDVAVAAYGTSVLLVDRGPDDPGVQVSDFMTGRDGPVDVPMVYGLGQSGDARLLSQQPFRTTNGAATTFVYEVKASNLAEEEQVFTFDFIGVPDHWDVSVPFDTAAIAGGRTITIPVVVQSPFAHEHGDRQTFVVEMHSQDDPASVGRVELGVRYPEIPQPAGHHDTLWLHTAPEERGVSFDAATGAGRDDIVVYMNALEDDEDDTGAEAYADRASIGFFSDDVPFTATGHRWDVRLSPSLALGLAFEEAEGLLSIPVRSDVPNQGAWLQGQLVWMGPDRNPGGDEDREEVVVATFEEDVVVDGHSDLEAVVRPAAATVDYVAGAVLELRIGLAVDRPDTFLGPQAEQAALLPGGTLRLPLLEYEDPLDGVLVNVGAIHTEVANATRFVNPGATTVFEVDVDAPAAIQAELLGSNRDWATLKVASDHVTVSVSPPADAVDEDRADLVLVLRADEDRAFVRLTAIVDTDAVHADQSGTQDKASPVGGAVLLAPLGALAMRRLSPRR